MEVEHNALLLWELLDDYKEVSIKYACKQLNLSAPAFVAAKKFLAYELGVNLSYNMKGDSLLLN